MGGEARTLVVVYTQVRQSQESTCSEKLLRRSRGPQAKRCHLSALRGEKAASSCRSATDAGTSSQPRSTSREPGTIHSVTTRLPHSTLQLQSLLIQSMGLYYVHLQRV